MGLMWDKTIALDYKLEFYVKRSLFSLSPFAICCIYLKNWTFDSFIDFKVGIISTWKRYQTFLANYLSLA